MLYDTTRPQLNGQRREDWRDDRAIEPEIMRRPRPGNDDLAPAQAASSHVIAAAMDAQFEAESKLLRAQRLARRQNEFVDQEAARIEASDAPAWAQVMKRGNLEVQNEEARGQLQAEARRGTGIQETTVTYQATRQDRRY